MIDDIEDQEAARQISHLHGRMTAMETLMTLEVMNFAKTQTDPFQFIQSYVQAVRATIKGLAPDIVAPGAARQLKDTRDALDEFLSGLLIEAGQLPRKQD